MKEDKERIHESKSSKVVVLSTPDEDDEEDWDAPIKSKSVMQPLKAIKHQDDIANSIKEMMNKDKPKKEEKV